MSHTKVRHATVVVERIFKSSPEKVFSAWKNPEQFNNWNHPGSEGWALAEYKQDFRNGGETRTVFGPKENPNIVGLGRFMNIVPNERIIAVENMHQDNEPLSTTLMTAEFIAEGSGTRLLITDQCAFYSWETESDRTDGWNEMLDRLVAAVA